MIPDKISAAPWGTVRLLGILVVILCSVAPLARGDDFTATVDRRQLSLNETLTLTLSYGGQTMDSPDLSALHNQFEVLSQQRQSQLSFGFGNGNTSSTDWIIALAPREAGRLRIPAIAFEGQQTKPIFVEVSKSPPAAGSSTNVFVETSLDTDTAWPQSQVILTIKLNTAVMLNGVDISELEVPGAQALKVHDTQYRKTIDGREYIVLELKYAIFPETPGELRIPPVTIAGVVPAANDSFGRSSLFPGRGKTVRLRSDEKTLQVTPRPAAAQGGQWLPATDVQLSQRWSREPETLKVGEPITRSITVTAEGLTGAQIPPLPSPDIAGLRRYPDQPDITQTLSEQGVTGIRTESVAIVPTQPGPLTLPAVTLQWWDTASETLRTARLDPVEVQVAASAEAPGTTPAAERPSQRPDSDNSDGGGTESEAVAPGHYWLYLSVAVNVLLVLALLWLLLRGRQSSSRALQESVPGDTISDEKQAFRDLQAIPTHETRRFRQQVLAWARLFWPENRVNSLADVGRLGGDERLAELFTAMDKSLYGSGAHKSTDPGDADTAAIVDILKGIRKRWTANGTRPSPLHSLYPNN